MYSYHLEVNYADSQEKRGGAASAFRLLPESNHPAPMESLPAYTGEPSEKYEGCEV